MEQKNFIISLGGSLIAPPEGINVSYLKKFRKLILEFTRKNYCFFIVTGGGSTAREYQKAAREIAPVSDYELDWLGIHSSRLNARLVKNIFGHSAFSQIVKNPLLKTKTNKKIIIAGGWKPGWSTDYVAAVLAQINEIKTIINFSNIDYAYTGDPRKDKSARIIKSSSWKEFRKIIGNKWQPGLSKPFDPIASKKAEKLNLTVIIANGRKLDNLKKILTGKSFKGTIIS